MTSLIKSMNNWRGQTKRLIARSLRSLRLRMLRNPSHSWSPWLKEIQRSLSKSLKCRLLLVSWQHQLSPQWSQRRVQSKRSKAMLLQSLLQTLSLSCNSHLNLANLLSRSCSRLQKRRKKSSQSQRTQSQNQLLNLHSLSWLNLKPHPTKRRKQLKSQLKMPSHQPSHS